MSDSRAARLRRTPPIHDPENPPSGTRLWLGVVAAKLGVTVADMADVTGASREQVADLLTNRWPQDAEQRHMQDALARLMVERGANAEELRSLFHAYGRQGVKHPHHGPDGRYQQPSKARRRKAGAAPKDIDMLIAKQTLSPQARRHFKLFRNPFEGDVLSDEQFFVGTETAYCREAIWQCAQTASFMALVGESGAGKTTLLQELELRLEREHRQLTLFKPSVLGMEGSDANGKPIKSADILHAIITTLKPDMPMPVTLQARTVAASKLLAGSAQSGNEHLLVVEEAHCMPDAALKHLKRMHELRLIRKPLMGILLLAQPELKQRLADGLREGTLREVAQRCEVVELLPLDTELVGYLRQRAKAAGTVLASLMDDGAVEQLRARLTFQRGDAAISMCYPLAVNNVITRALNIAADLGAPVVSREIVQAV